MDSRLVYAFLIAYAQAVGVPTALIQHRNNIAIGELVPVGRALAPCTATATPAASMERTSEMGTWVGSFVVSDPGIGQWQLKIEVLDAGEVPATPGALEYVIGSAASPAGQRIVTDQISAKKVRVSLVPGSTGPSSASSRCPTVVLDRELQPVSTSKPRGIFDRDDRWREDQNELSVQPDSANIHRWASSVVKLNIIGANGQFLPCSAFFVSGHVLITAAHCILTQTELDKAVLFLVDRQIPGSELKLFATHGDLDVSLMWLEKPVQTASLTTGGDDAGPFVVWQYAFDLGKVVSVKGCVLDEFSGMLIHHRCDTAPGASGAPIQTRQSGAVVGVHTDGCTTLSGTSSCENFGTRMEQIRAWIKSQAKELRALYPALADETLRALGAQ